MDIDIIRKYIGIFSPLLLFFISFLLLLNLTNYLHFFIGGFIVNIFLNVILKLIIKEPRPLEDKKAIEIAVENNRKISFNKFGMPSGHAQEDGFCLAFIACVLKNMWVTTGYILITIITLYQRYTYKKHTLLQIGLGLVIGLAVGYITYVLSRKFIEGHVKMKEDDDAPL